MKNEEPVKASTLGRREFMKAGAAGAGAVMTAGALITALTTDRASAQSTKGKPWWAAQPGKGGVGKPISIDMHAHWTPQVYLKALADMGHPIANPYPLAFDLEMRRKWMDDHGVLMHVLTLDGGMPWEWASAEDGARLARIMNDAAVEAHNAFPDRYTAGIEIPVKDPVMGLKELNRVAGKPGMRAVHLPDSYDRRDYLFEPAFAPVLARIEALNLPIIFHQIGGDPNNYGGPRTAGPPNLSAALDAPIEHAVIASKFIVTGTLDTYPNLQIVLPHAGGAFPYLAGRVEHFLYHMGGGTFGQAKMARPFREYIRRFHYDYLTYYPETFRFLVELVGADRIVVGTDGFAAKDIEYPTAVLDQFNLPAADRERILKGNAMRLLRL